MLATSALIQFNINKKRQFSATAIRRRCRRRANGQTDRTNRKSNELEIGATLKRRLERGLEEIFADLW